MATGAASGRGRARGAHVGSFVSGGSSGVGGWRVGLVGLDVQDRDEREAQVADLLEQAVQRGLVDDRAVQDGGAVGLVGEAQPVEPGGPPVVEVALEADLVRPASCQLPAVACVSFMTGR